MLGRMLLVGLAVLVASPAVGGCASNARADQPAGAASTSVPAISGSSTANSSHDAAANQPKGLLAEQRALALAAAHLDANQIAVGRNNPQASGWPSGISAVTAVAGPGTVSDSNTGHTCESGTIISVRLLGAFDTVTTGRPTGPGTAGPDNTVREIDLSVDATTGLTCLISVRTEPALQSRDETLLYSR